MNNERKERKKKERNKEYITVMLFSPRVVVSSLILIFVCVCVVSLLW
jgi:hypothetical protein